MLSSCIVRLITSCHQSVKTVLIEGLLEQRVLLVSGQKIIVNVKAVDLGFKQIWVENAQKVQNSWLLAQIFDNRSSNRSNTSSERKIVNERPAESANSSQMYPTQTSDQKSSHVCSSPQCYRAVTDWVLQRLKGNIQDVNQGVFKSTTAPFKTIINWFSIFSSL